ncbi:hypothetical protein [Fimbriiglobus ruber]|uniref:Uncharacterized protein n=1 Tax=Fimbriiglobus ruber TaxID=1908690 RepID=A0A225E6H9_9BACT|nr:hypothetical protein [Fimbriiglobus ruber]OWK45716.1 hypothetical protein FRUB_02047 [Fimbriiglobus ruber]
MSDAEVIHGGRGVWAATPWSYSSTRFLILHANGSGRLVYAYGQTIYANILCRWEVPSAGVLRLDYLETPADGHRFKEFSPGADAVRELRYTLSPGMVSGEDDIVGLTYRFHWTLELSEQPWPPGLSLPYEVPRVFFGHRQGDSQDVESGESEDEWE